MLGSEAPMRSFFGWTQMRAIAAGACVAAPFSIDAAELQPRTVAAFERHVAATEARMGAELEGAARFIWLDTLPEERRRAAIDAVRRPGTPRQDDEVSARRLEADAEGLGSAQGGGGHRTAHPANIRHARVRTANADGPHARQRFDGWLPARDLARR